MVCPFCGYDQNELMNGTPRYIRKHVRKIFRDNPKLFRTYVEMNSSYPSEHGFDTPDDLWKANPQIWIDRGTRSQDTYFQYVLDQVESGGHLTRVQPYDQWDSH